MSTTPPAAPGLGARLARNSLHSASGRIVAMLAWLVLTPPLVRTLGPEGFGVWSLFYAVAGWLGAIDLGFSQVALRFGAAARARAAREEAGEYGSLAVLGYLVLGAVFFLLVLALHPLLLDLLRIHGDPRPLAAAAFLAAPAVFVLTGLVGTCMALLQAWDRFDLANGVSLTVSLGQVAAIALALSLGGGLVACVAAVAAGWAVALLLGLALLPRGIPGWSWARPAAATARLREAAAFGLPIQLSNAFAIAHQQIGKLMLVRGVSLATAGSYELGLRATAAAFTFAQLALVAMLPEASVLHEQEAGERLRALHARGGRIVMAMAAVLAAALVAAAPAVFPAWIGRPDPAAELALRGLALAAFAGIVGGLSGAIGRGVGRTRLEIEWSGLALAIHAGLGALLIPRVGLVGALVAILAANVVAALWFTHRLGRALGWRGSRTLWEPFLVPGLAVAAGALAGDRVVTAIAAPWAALVAAGAVATAVSTLVLFALRQIRWAEIVGLLRRGAAA